MYKNKITDIVLTEEEYWGLRKREIREEWENMDEKDQLEWKSYEEFERWDLERNVDLDFAYIED